MGENAGDTDKGRMTENGDGTDKERPLASPKQDEDKCEVSLYKNIDPYAVTCMIIFKTVMQDRQGEGDRKVEGGQTNDRTLRQDRQGEGDRKWS